MLALALIAALVRSAPAAVPRSSPMPRTSPTPRSSPAPRAYNGLTLAPDGTRFIAAESAGEEAPGTRSTLTIRSRNGMVLGTIECGTGCVAQAPAWSHDGAHLAYLARDAKAGTVTLRVGGPSGADARAVTTIKGEVSQPKWSPDDSRVALLAVVDPHKTVGATQAGAALVGDIGRLTVADEQRLDVVDVATGRATFASPADTWVYEYDWTPDGRGFAATAAKGNGDENWWVARLVAFDATTGAERAIAAPPMQMNAPRVSPDGTTVAFIGGLMSDFGSVGGDVYTVAFTGGMPVDITPDYRGSFTSLGWHGIGGGLTATALDGEKTALVALDPVRRTTRTVWTRTATIAAGGDTRVAFSRDGSVAATVEQSFDHAARVIAGAPAALQPVTHDNDGFIPVVRARNVSWQSDGFTVQGWLLEPPTLAPGKKYPMIVEVHGGPSAASTPRFVWRGSERELIAGGYFVFLPNPRGSYGQGEAFTAANKRDFGGGDLRDILAGVDAAEKIAPIDDAKLGVFGHSYGGFMTMWTVTQTQRFKAAVAGAGIANWISYYGENGIDTWMLPFFGGSAYDDPAIYQKLSPLTYIKNAKTPTFVYVGERDVECPAPQSLEFWRGLRANGVPSELMIYEGEGHAIRRPDHARDLSSRIAAWFGRYLQ